jgi:FkbM family methyltransferase
MILHPAAVLRRSAQSIRHAPGLRRFGALWERLRVPYRRILIRLADRNGLPVTIGGQTMRLAPDVVNLNWETVEVESYRAFAEAIAPGDVIFDVGAHFGTYTLIGAARGGPDTLVVAYEPCDLTRQYLMRHLRWNGAERQVLVRPVCCGSASGSVAFFHRPGRPEGINGLLPHEDLVQTTVRQTTLDREVEELGLVPALIKIDVEGAELDVLKGAARVLDVHRPRVLVSLHPKRLAQVGADCETVLAWLRAHRYQADVVGEDQEIHVLARPISTLNSQVSTLEGIES